MNRLCCLCFLILGATFIAGAQDKTINDANAQQRTASGFHTIKVEDGVDLFLTQGDKEAVAVSASKAEYRDKIITVVKEGVLHISVDQNALQMLGWRNRQMRAYVAVIKLKEIRASGGSDIKIESGLKADDLTLSLSGGSDFSGSIECQNLEIRASGGSDVRLSGKAVNLKLSASGGSDFHAYDMIADNVFVSASGGSDARITALKELGVECSGGSDVDYKGNAVIKYKSSSGGSSVSKRN